MNATQMSAKPLCPHKFNSNTYQATIARFSGSQAQKVKPRNSA